MSIKQFKYIIVLSNILLMSIQIEAICNIMKNGLHIFGFTAIFIFILSLPSVFENYNILQLKKNKDNYSQSICTINTFKILSCTILTVFLAVIKCVLSL